MKLSRVYVKNFRLLKEIDVLLDDATTVVVGRNNSGKTSFAELFRRLLLENVPTFSLQDFSMGVHEDFWNAFVLLNEPKDDDQVRAVLPSIQVRLILTYDQGETDLGYLSDFIVDLNPECTEVHINIIYQLDAGKVKPFFSIPNFDPASDIAKQRSVFFHSMKELVPKHYKCALVAIDPNDQSNQKPMEWSKLRLLIQGDLIGAHRGLDDVTHKDNDALGRILGALFSTADTATSSKTDQEIANDLKTAVSVIQDEIGTSFNTRLQRLLPAFKLFNYPGLTDPKLITETLLDVELLLKNHTRIRYSGVNGVHLPEAYNGLGTRNLIYILLKLHEAFKTFKAKPSTPSVHIIFIEEPEAHLHPQMQEVFISQLDAIAAAFSDMQEPKVAWPVQFVVSTHSSHLANKAKFEAMRYFLAVPDTATGNTYVSKVKDLKQGFKTIPPDEYKFLHQYMTLTRCDLLFADKAILIEGTTERLLMPCIIEKVDVNQPLGLKLSNQYVSVMEVGGAYAHIFFKLLDFLELRSLIITDLDTVDANDDGKACKVSQGTGSSNACINAWFATPCTPQQLLAKTEAEKIMGQRRLTYQIPEVMPGVCGRSFEDTFMLANAGVFPQLDQTDLEESAWTQAKKEKKSAFALRYAIDITAWTVPRYIKEGLVWLAINPPPPAPIVAGIGIQQ